MKPACILGAVALVIGCVAIPSLGHADGWEGWRGSGGWGADSPYNRSYDPTKEETMFSYCEMRRASPPGLAGVERGDPGRSVRAHPSEGPRAAGGQSVPAPWRDREVRQGWADAHHPVPHRHWDSPVRVM
jgi:hypothetical protein